MQSKTINNIPLPKDAHILSLDSSMNGVGVCVYNGDNKRYFGRKTLAEKEQAQILIPEIQHCLKEAGLNYDALQYIVCTKGPGSFTGLRVSLASAKAMALALDIPIYGLNTLEVLSYQFKQHAIIITETKRQDFYFQLFDAHANALAPPSVINPSDLNTYLQDAIHTKNQIDKVLKSEDAITIIGNCSHRIKESITIEHMDKYIRFEDVEIAEPEVIIQLFQDRFESCESDTAAGLFPLYLRGADISQPKYPPPLISKT